MKGIEQVFFTHEQTTVANHVAMVDNQIQLNMLSNTLIPIVTFQPVEQRTIDSMFAPTSLGAGKPVRNGAAAVRGF